jgi:hypothetical protein
VAPEISRTPCRGSPQHERLGTRGAVERRLAVQAPRELAQAGVERQPDLRERGGVERLEHAVVAGVLDRPGILEDRRGSRGVEHLLGGVLGPVQRGLRGQLGRVLPPQLHDPLGGPHRHK